MYCCVNYCRCLAKRSDILDGIYQDYLDMLIRDLGSIQIADWDDDEGSEDSEES